MFDKKIPEKWIYKGYSESLLDYFLNLSLKKDFLMTTIITRKGELPPILPLNRLFDPFSVLYNLMTSYSNKNKVIINVNKIIFSVVWVIYN